MGRVEITRQLGIDMGHRVTNHQSKCRNVHGHRYLLEATATAEALVGDDDGPAGGMVVDFGVLKTAMMAMVDDLFDHTLCVWYRDPLVAQWAARGEIVAETLGRSPGLAPILKHFRLATLESCSVEMVGRVVLVQHVPTAERLAKLWFTLVNDEVRGRTVGRVWLTKMRVWETPNCYAEFVP